MGALKDWFNKTLVNDVKRDVRELATRASTEFDTFANQSIMDWYAAYTPTQYNRMYDWIGATEQILEIAPNGLSAVAGARFTPETVTEGDTEGIFADAIATGKHGQESWAPATTSIDDLMKQKVIDFLNSIQ